MYNKTLYVVIVIVIILLFLKYQEYNKDYTQQVMEAIAKTEREKLQFAEFKRLLDAPNFDVITFTRLMHAYKEGKLTQEKAARLIAGQIETLVDWN